MPARCFVFFIALAFAPRFRLSPLRPMTVGSLMTRDVVTVREDASIFEIRRRFQEGKFHHLLIVDDEDALAGVISDRDVLQAVSPFLDTRTEQPRDVKTLEQEARDLIKRDPVTIQSSLGVEKAAQRLLEHGVSCLPVVRDDGSVEGIVTSRDLLRATAGDAAR